MYFRKNKQNEDGYGNKQEERKTAPGTDIRYDPNLISMLKNDHQTLLGLYMEIKSAFDEQDYKTVTAKLNKFRNCLQEHLLIENVKLYIYLTHTFKIDDTNYELILSFRREMDAIARTAMNFLRKYEAIGVDAELATSFGSALVNIGEVLGTRIQKEENVLYPLYMEHY